MSDTSHIEDALNHYEKHVSGGSYGHAVLGAAREELASLRAQVAAGEALAEAAREFVCWVYGGGIERGFTLPEEMAEDLRIALAAWDATKKEVSARCLAGDHLGCGADRRIARPVNANDRTPAEAAILRCPCTCHDGSRR